MVRQAKRARFRHRLGWIRLVWSANSSRSREVLGTIRISDNFENIFGIDIRARSSISLFSQIAPANLEGSQIRSA